MLIGLMFFLEAIQLTYHIGLLLLNYQFINSRVHFLPENMQFLTK